MCVISVHRVTSLAVEQQTPRAYSMMSLLMTHLLQDPSAHERNTQSTCYSESII